jgi:hypothetical protein
VTKLIAFEDEARGLESELPAAGFRNLRIHICFHPDIPDSYSALGSALEHESGEEKETEGRAMRSGRCDHRRFPSLRRDNKSPDDFAFPFDAWTTQLVRLTSPDADWSSVHGYIIPSLRDPDRRGEDSSNISCVPTFQKYLDLKVEETKQASPGHVGAEGRMDWADLSQRKRCAFRIYQFFSRGSG